MDSSNQKQAFAPYSYNNPDQESTHMKTKRRNGLSPLLPSVDAGHEQNLPPAAVPDAITIQTPPVPAPTPSRVYTEAELNAERERIRREEKDKLYGDRDAEKERLAAFQRQVDELTASKQAEIAEAEKKAREEAQAEAEKRWAEMDSKSAVEQVRSEFEDRFAKLQEQQETERAVFNREREFNALAEYARGQVAVALDANELAPELADLVTGNTQAEIDSSLETLKAKSAQIAQAVQQATQQARVQQRGVAPTGHTPAGPMDTNPGTRTLTPADIAAMPMSEYAKIRGQLVGGGSTNENRGLFG